MAKFECSVCGYIFDEAQAGIQFSEIDVCPICNESRDVFKRLDDEEESKPAEGAKAEPVIVGDEQKAEQEKKEAEEGAKKLEEAEKKDSLIEGDEKKAEEGLKKAEEDAKKIEEDAKKAEEDKKFAEKGFVIEKRQEFWLDEADDKPVDKSNISTYYEGAKPVKTQEELDREAKQREEENRPRLDPMEGNGAVVKVIEGGDRSSDGSDSEVVVVEENTAEDSVKADVAEATSDVDEGDDEFVFEEVTVEDGAPLETKEIPSAASSGIYEEGNFFTGFDTNPTFGDVVRTEEFVFDDEEPVGEAVELPGAEEIPVAEETTEPAAEEAVAEEAPVEEAPVEEAPAEEPEVEEVSAEEVVEEAAEPVAEEAVAEEAPAEEEVAEETPAEEPAVEEVPAEEVVEEAAEPAAEEVVAEEAPVEEAPVEETTVKEVVAEEAAEPVDEAPAEEAPVEEVVAEEAAEPVEEAPAEEEAAAEPEEEIHIPETTEAVLVGGIEEAAKRHTAVVEDGKYNLLTDEQVKSLFEQYANPVTNGLDDIILLPAQLNPMPIPKDEEIDASVVIGTEAEMPVKMDEPFGNSDMFRWGEYIPGSDDLDDADGTNMILVKGINSHIPAVSGREELRTEVKTARDLYNGVPVGISLMIGRIEQDLAACTYAGVDFVILNDASSGIIPYALRRAKNYLSRVNSKMQILVSIKDVNNAQEIAKLIALGADYILLEREYSVEETDGLVAELKEIARNTGHSHVRSMNMYDICTIDSDLNVLTR